MQFRSRREILKMTTAAGAALVGSASGFSAFAQGSQWPTKPVSLVVGYSPGGLTDVGARFISKGMGESLGQSFIVDNKPGASGNIAANEVLRTSDDYKLLVANTGLTTNPHTGLVGSPDPTKFTSIGLILESQLILCVNPSSPAKSFPQFIDWVKAESTKSFSYATPGAGSNTHLAMEYFRERVGLPPLTQVPYKGSALAINDVVGGQVPCVMDAASLVLPFIAVGKLRPILTTGRARHPALPDIPTAMELGIKDFVVTAFVALWGPPNMPADAINRANSALNKALADSTVRATIVRNGDLVGGGTPEQLAALTRENYKLWGEVARRNNIRAE